MSDTLNEAKVRRPVNDTASACARPTRSRVEQHGQTSPMWRLDRRKVLGRALFARGTEKIGGVE